MSPQPHNSFVPPAEFALVEEEIRRFSGELYAELKEKEEECRLAKEEALLRITEMEREGLARVEGEWDAREKALADLERDLLKELERLTTSAGRTSAEEELLKALSDDLFAKLLGEES